MTQLYWSLTRYNAQERRFTQHSCFTNYTMFRYITSHIIGNASFESILDRMNDILIWWKTCMRQKTLEKLAYTALNASCQALVLLDPVDVYVLFQLFFRDKTRLWLARRESCTVWESDLHNFCKRRPTKAKFWLRQRRQVTTLTACPKNIPLLLRLTFPNADRFLKLIQWQTWQQIFDKELISHHNWNITARNCLKTTRSSPAWQNPAIST